MLITKNQIHWREELKTAVKTHRELECFLNQKVPEVNYPFFLPKRFLEKIKKAGRDSPLWKQFIPDERENSLWGLKDPIGDHLRNPVGHIIHRYPSRVLLMPTPFCPVLCRYCFRKNELHVDDTLFRENLKEAFAYIKQHSEIHEVILSGGDPLMLGEKRLRFIFDNLLTITSIKDLRIHTRALIVLPSRVTPEFLELIEYYKHKFRFFHIVIHTNHATEICEDVQRAVMAVFQTGVPLLSQSVLLKGVNNSPQGLADLVEKLLECKIRPYYLHHPDRVQGGRHFFLSLEEGEKIYAGLKNRHPGWAVPKYVVDSPSGTGKIGIEKAIFLDKISTKRP